MFAFAPIIFINPSILQHSTAFDASNLWIPAGAGMTSQARSFTDTCLPNTDHRSLAKAAHTAHQIPQPTAASLRQLFHHLLHFSELL